jgi:hypothetical protein
MVFVIIIILSFGRTRICNADSNWSRIDVLSWLLPFNISILCSKFCISLCLWFSITLLSKSNSSDIISYCYTYLVASKEIKNITVVDSFYE